jgi:hypothetical protein
LPERSPAVEKLLFPGPVAAIEDHQMSLFAAATVEILPGLFQTLGDGLRPGLVQDLELDHCLLHSCHVGSDD